MLSAPFATAYPPLLQAALHAVQTIIVVDWPRMAYHRGEVLKGLVVCWCRIEDEGDRSAELKVVQRQIKHGVKLLTAVLKRELDIEPEYKLLVESDDRLGQLLVVP